jgi:hypothetical protein
MHESILYTRAWKRGKRVGVSWRGIARGKLGEDKSLSSFPSAFPPRYVAKH